MRVRKRRNPTLHIPVGSLDQRPIFRMSSETKLDEESEAKPRWRLPTSAEWVLLGILVVIALATIPMADCPACVDGIGLEMGDEGAVVYPCKLCSSYRKKVPLLARWRYLYITAR